MRAFPSLAYVGQTPEGQLGRPEPQDFKSWTAKVSPQAGGSRVIFLFRIAVWLLHHLVSTLVLGS